MREALDLAQQAQVCDEVPVGAVVVQDGCIIGKGFNQPIRANDPSAHAEIVAIRLAARHLGNYRMPGTTLFVTLEPCVMCVGAILQARIQRLVFGAHDPSTGAAGSVFNLMSDRRHNHAVEITGGILERECSLLLKEFFRLRRQIK